MMAMMSCPCGSIAPLLLLGVLFNAGESQTTAAPSVAPTVATVAPTVVTVAPTAVAPGVAPVVGTTAPVNTGTKVNVPLANLVNTDVCPAMSALSQGASVTLRKYSVARKMDISGFNGSSDLGTVSAPVYSFQLQLELKSTAGSKIAYLVNPAAFWATKAEMYDCHDKKFAEIQSTDSNLAEMINPLLKTFDILDANGTKVATMEKLAGFDSVGLIVSQETVIQLKMVSAPWHERVLGMFGAYQKASITFVQTTIVTIPPLLKDPRFLALLAADELAPGNLGPFWVILSYCLWPLLIICCCLNCCCRKERKDTGTRMVTPTEEQKPLVMNSPNGAPYGQVPQLPLQQNQSAFARITACCTRKAAAPPGYQAYPPRV